MRLLVYHFLREEVKPHFPIIGASSFTSNHSPAYGLMKYYPKRGRRHPVSPYFIQPFISFSALPIGPSGRPFHFSCAPSSAAKGCT